MSWNYRLFLCHHTIDTTGEKTYWFEVKSAYYKRKNSKLPHSWSICASSVISEDMKWTLNRMKDSLKKPVLMETDDGNKVKEIGMYKDVVKKYKLYTV